MTAERARLRALRHQARQRTRIEQRQREAAQRERARRNQGRLERCLCNPPQIADRLPFGPGEELGYVISIGGIYAGRVDLKIGASESLTDHLVYPATAHADTNSFFSKMSKVEGHQTSYFTPEGVIPLTMFARSHLGDVQRDESASFDIQRHTADATLVYPKREWRGTVEGGAPIQDVLSVVYFARSRELAEGQDYCVELYYGKRLWVVRGRVVGRELVSTPAGPYRALKITGEAARDGLPALVRPLTVWISQDDDRLPLQLTSPSAYGEIEVKIDQFRRGRRLVHDVSALR
ncbi:MAG: DUF3108 domain-containing protein [Deltaproteobacteria bacterium]|nr:DUF3108 domain-containing protein [Deltaproteobacteria bacterium]